MPPIALHALIGLGLSVFVRDKAAKVGLVLGLVLPDIDVIFSTIMLGLTADPNLVVAAHRSVTHNGFFIIGILVVAAIFAISGSRKIKIGRWNSRAISVGLLALSIGVFLHMFMDLFYMTGVSLLWPLSGEQFSIVPPILDTATDVGKKVIAALDLLAEVVTYSAFLYLAIKKRTDKHMRKPLAIAAVLNVVVYVPLFFLAQTAIAVNDFVLLAYVPGFFFTLFSVALPWLMRRTIFALGTR